MGASKHLRLWRVKVPKINGVHTGETDRLDASHSAFILRARRRAEEVRALKLDPGEAYLQGIADFRAAQIRDQLIDSFTKPDYIAHK